jgi:hypothetical protein
MELFWIGLIARKLGSDRSSSALVPSGGTSPHKPPPLPMRGVACYGSAAARYVSQVTIGCVANRVESLHS